MREFKECSNSDCEFYYEQLSGEKVCRKYLDDCAECPDFKCDSNCQYCPFFCFDPIGQTWCGLQVDFDPAAIYE